MLSKRFFMMVRGLSNDTSQTAKFKTSMRYFGMDFVKNIFHRARKCLRYNPNGEIVLNLSVLESGALGWPAILANGDVW